jgi:RNA polymerase sigma factor (sigma-70 family)
MGARLPAQPRPTIREVFEEDLGFLMAVARKVMGGRRAADVEDAVSVALWEIQKSLPRFDPERATRRVWMYRIVERAASRYAQRGRRVAALMVPWSEAQPEGLAGTEAMFDDRLTNDELQRLWRELSAQMDEGQRELLALNLCGMTGDEIAELRGQNPNTTRSLLTLARQELGALHRERQARQSRAGVAVLPLAFATWQERVEASAQHVPDAMRARLLERLESGGGPSSDPPPPRLRTLAPLAGLPPLALMPGATAVIVAAVVFAAALLLAFAPTNQPAAPQAAATASAPGALEAEPAFTPPRSPSQAPSAARAPASSASSVAPRAASIPPPPPSTRAQEQAIIRGIRNALNEHRPDVARARLADYDRHFPAGHFREERDALARILAKLPP